jgi:DNA-binding response OmpR family regulator
MSAPTVLLVDDDEAVRRMVRSLLEREGYAVCDAPDGAAGLRELYDRRPELAIVDADMPEMDGYTLVERIREVSQIPVLMLTGHGDELQKVRALRLGADDHVTKPFGRQELLARVEALLRRARQRAPAAAAGYRDGRLIVDPARHEASVDGRPLALTPLELRLLSVLTAHAGRILSHDQLLEHVWGGTSGTSPDQVRLYVSYVRRKLEAAGLPGDALETVRGFGYRWRGASST